MTGQTYNIRGLIEDELGNPPGSGTAAIITRHLYDDLGRPVRRSLRTVRELTANALLEHCRFASSSVLGGLSGSTPDVNRTTLIVYDGADRTVQRMRRTCSVLENRHRSSHPLRVRRSRGFRVQRDEPRSCPPSRL